jgi:hypothetical protein
LEYAECAPRTALAVDGKRSRGGRNSAMIRTRAVAELVAVALSVIATLAASRTVGPTTLGSTQLRL